MKNENINYANKITSKMVSDLSKVIEVQEFTLDDLTIIINDLKNEQKEKVIEEIINNQLNELKNNKDIDIRKVFKQVDDITDYFIKYYDDDSDIVSECDQIADDLLFKAIGRNERKLELPVSSSYIKNYCLSSNISNNQLLDSLVWIALRLVAINYCIRFNSSLEDNNED
ncbi:MAG: hypothetical protein J6O56_03850 [Bacilli bacterium]|nr:hypothetical protein [Bacilli bacterium]